MKKIINISLFVLSFLGFALQNLLITKFHFAFASSKYITFSYAQVKEDNVYLYKTNLSTFLNNAYFEIPKSYFVMLLNNIDETFYKVQYKSMVGYVLKEKVTPVLEKPVNPYLENVSFRIYAQDGLNLMSSPFASQTPQVILSLPPLPTLEYFGKINGDEIVEGRGTTWFYCQPNNLESTTTQESKKGGYVYAGFCDNLTPFSENTEKLTPTSNPFDTENQEYLYYLINLPSFLKALIISLVCIPALILILLLFKPFKIQKRIKQKKISNNRTKTQTFNKIQKIVEEDDTI